MTPLSFFPELLTYGLVAPFILRLSVGVLILLFGSGRYKKPYKFTSIVYFITGVLLILGLYTQLAAILGMIVISFDFWVDKKISSPTKENLLLHAVAKIILLSLLFTGPGFLAFDLPL